VSNNNVEAAYKQLAAQCSEAGLYEELKKRDHHISTQERKFELVRHKYNKIIGQKIKQRMRWIVKRSKLKLCK
jgi:ribosomal protein S21